MKVSMLVPARGNSEYMGELEEAALRVIRSGKYILGLEVETFEKDCAEYLGVKHAIGVSSGTDALLMALMASDIGPEDEVICPTFTFFATAGSVSRTGATPVFVDIYPDCFTIDVDAVEKAITPETKAIIPVHLFGQSAKMKELLDLAKKHNLVVIEDAAQAIGAEYAGQRVGSVGSFGCFSFFPSKNLGGFGDAGLVTTQSDSMADKLRSIRNHGMKEQYRHDRVGGNFRIDAIQAALLAVKLRYLPGQEQQRIDHAALYRNALLGTEAVYTLPEECRGKHVYNQFTIRVKDGKRDELKGYLKAKGVGCAVYYPVSLHQQECFTYLGTGLVESEMAGEECLSIPIASEISDTEIKYVCKCLAEFAKSC